MHRKNAPFLLMTLVALTLLSCHPYTYYTSITPYFKDNGSNWETVITPTGARFLRGEMLNIHVAPSDVDGRSHVVILLTEMGGPVLYSPSRMAIKQSNGNILKGKAYKCSYRKFGSAYYKMVEPETDNILIASEACYWLVFDGAVAQWDDATLHIDDALSFSNTNLRIPPVHFATATRREMHLGLFQ